jgi:valyl-tRNA synthetase
VRLLAPFLPFVTEETWSWWRQGSVHHAAWPSRAEIESVLGTPAVEGPEAAVSAHASLVTAGIRHQRSLAKLGFGAPVRVELTLTSEIEGSWPLIERYVREGNNAAEITCRPGPEFAVTLVPVVPVVPVVPDPNV